MTRPSKKVAICATSSALSDQRIQRIASSLSTEGYEIFWISKKDEQMPNGDFHMVTLPMWQKKGVLFYLEINIRIFFKLLRINPDVLYICDADALLGAAKYKWMFRKNGVYDSHEYYIESPELIGRPFRKGFWNIIEKFWAPKMDAFITVNEVLAEILTKRLKRPFKSIRNLPVSLSIDIPENRDKILIYQGVLNMGRGLEIAIEAMDDLQDYKLWIIGDGDIRIDLEQSVAESKSRERIELFKKMNPSKLRTCTLQARYGINILDDTSLNYKYSLANKFFDYMHAGVPSINSKLPLYLKYIEEYQCGICVEDYSVRSLVHAIRTLDSDEDRRESLVMNSIEAAKTLHWEEEAKKLVKIFSSL